MTTHDHLLESYPANLEDHLDEAAAKHRALADNYGELEFLVSDLDRWPSGDVISVAFLGGTTDLHAAIADATQEINEACGVRLDFGFSEETKEYRSWSESDAEYAADIRVSFDQSGYWSLVGTSSIDRDIAPTESAVGGAPHQRSMNLGGFARRLPDGWRRTVLHEFLHALAFKHEHQNARGACQAEFRWDDDPDYEETTDACGRFQADANGRRPGIYTYLGGPPNNWTRRKIDHNLRSDGLQDTAMGPFDVESVMLYRFNSLFYKTNPSKCAPIGDGHTLSSGDIRGLQLLYPFESSTSDARLEQVRAARLLLDDLDGHLEKLGGEGTVNGLRHVLDRLSREHSR